MVNRYDRPHTARGRQVDRMSLKHPHTSIQRRPAEEREPLDPGLLHGDLATRHFRVTRYPPRDELKDVISHHAVLEWDLRNRRAYTPRALDKPGSGIVWDRNGFTFHGAKTRLYAYRMEGTGRVYGTKFSPAGASSLVRSSMREMVNQEYPVSTVLRHWNLSSGDPLDASDHSAALDAIEEQLMRCGLRSTPQQQRVDEIVRYVATTRDVFSARAVAAHFGIHLRSLQSLISTYVGPGIKWIICQFRIFDAIQALSVGRKPDLGMLAYDLGYSSQSHFTNDFKRVTGSSPRDYLKAGQANTDLH